MDKKIILMADNQPEFLKARSEILEQANYTVLRACSPEEAEAILAKKMVDLAVLDIRMIDDNDERDTSGLELARKHGAAVPIILLTAYPTWENVKAALGRDLNGLSAAVDFFSKKDHAEVMVQAVNLTIERPRFKRNVLHEFHVENYQALYEALQNNEPAESSEYLQKSLESTERELIENRKEILQEFEKSQKLAIGIGLGVMAIVLIGAVLAFFQHTTVAILSGVVGTLTEAVSVLFITRTVKASKKVDQKYEELQDIYRPRLLLSMCDTIPNRIKRENMKIAILKKLATKWIC